MPISSRFGPNNLVTWLERNDDLVRKGNTVYRIIRRLEPIVSIIDSDRRDAKHGPLYDVLTSHILDSKDQLRTIKEEVWHNNSFVFKNGNSFIFIAK